jgi:ribonuclease HI
LQVDPHAIQIRTDGSCLQRQKYQTGCAAIVIYPDSLDKEPEQILDFGCPESTNQRMELTACIKALRWVRQNAPWPGITRVQIITDSTYVKANISRAVGWRRNGWRNQQDEPKANVALWKEFLSVYSKLGVVVTIEQTKGKKDKNLKAVDEASKAAARRGGVNVDRGHRRGKIVRSAVEGGVATRLEANGQELVIRPYAKKVMERAQGENKLKFDVFCELQQAYVGKRFAFTSPELAFELHCHHGYRVRCNHNPLYPRITHLLEEVQVPPPKRSKSALI